MKTAKLKRLAEQTAATFRDEFPGQEPDLRWLAEAARIDDVPDAQHDAYFSEVRAALRQLSAVSMVFTAHNSSGTVLLPTGSYLAARRHWATYLSDNPMPSGLAGILVMDRGNQFTLDVTYLDRVAGYGSPDEREPTEDEVRAAFFM